MLDEADMFDMGFEPQVMRVMDNCRPDRQTCHVLRHLPQADGGTGQENLDEARGGSGGGKKCGQ